MCGLCQIDPTVTTGLNTYVAEADLLATLRVLDALEAGLAREAAAAPAGTP